MAKWHLVQVVREGGAFPESRAMLSTQGQGTVGELAADLEAIHAGEPWKSKYWAAYRATMAGVLAQVEEEHLLVTRQILPAENRRAWEAMIHSWFGLDAEGREVK